MLKNIVRVLAISGVIAVFTTSTQIVRAAERGEDADSRQVKMSFSGSIVPTALNVQPNSITDEELLAGHGSLGSFTFRKLRSDETTPIGFGSCGSGFGPSIRVLAGGGVFRFEDGSLLTVTTAAGGILCVDVSDPAHTVAHLTETFQITGGTGRFDGASGTLQSTGTLNLVFRSASGQPVLLVNRGSLTGTVQVP